jgi:hydroxybutyrate-dimer hydrolase
MRRSNPVSPERPPDREAARASVVALVLGALTALLSTAPSHADGALGDFASAPLRVAYDGVSDDLLTAGLGPRGLLAPPPPPDAQRLASFAERRRRAIHQNWRGLADLTAPMDDTRIAGIEILGTVAARGALPTSGFLLQIPAGFDPKRPCLLVTAASGSRGVFGALPTVGQWGLRRGCAVVTDDKSLGMGVVDRTAGLGVAMDGAPRPLAVGTSAAFPHALEMPHAHDRPPSEPLWGRLLLRAGEIALRVLSAEHPDAPAFTPERTLIIAAGISNGGGAVLQALEADRGRFFDGAVASEPNVLVAGAPTLFDYATLHALLQPCAILAEDLATAPLGFAVTAGGARHPAWCARLAADGLVSGGDTAAQAADARRRLAATGIDPAALRLGAINLQLNLWTAVTATYAQGYLRRGPSDPACGIGFAALDPAGRPRALTDAERLALFADGTGIAPTAGIQLLADGDVARALSYETARCLRDLAPDAETVARMAQVSGRTGKRPVIVLHGRADALVPIAHTSRAYITRATPHNPLLRFVEVARGQHFDALLALPGMRPGHVAMQPAVDRALDDVRGYLGSGTPLPPSTVLD